MVPLCIATDHPAIAATGVLMLLIFVVSVEAAKEDGAGVGKGCQTKRDGWVGDSTSGYGMEDPVGRSRGI